LEDGMTATAVTGASFARGGSKQDYQTPKAFMDAVVERFGPIAFDLAAHQGNHQVPSYFGPGSPLGEDSLTQDWTKLRGNLWLNPPYDDIAPWAEKCAASRGTHFDDRRILFLVPASVGAVWFDEHVHGHALVLGLVGRLTFVGTPRVEIGSAVLPGLGLDVASDVLDADGPQDPYPKDLILAVYSEPPGFDTWRWNRSAPRPQLVTGAS
jgi:site-specific DNA-methyltransferase (adenine-specific)